ncbi:MAG: peptidoglycan-binding protein [Rhodospirillales bacterium]|nr:peptidoglycan-binding protein [Rhodospirillales bacterium]
MQRKHAAVAAALLLGLAGCAQTPTTARVTAMPGPGKSFQAFQADQASCQQFAQAQVAGQAQKANQTTAIGAGAGVVGGAALGAAAGAIGGNAGTGAAIGALSGAVLGTAGGAYLSNQQQQASQNQFDQAYAQCMYSRGNNVQGFAPQAQTTSLSPANASLVQSVQEQLIRLHYLAPPADGIAGPQTISAITRFQQANGMPPTGEATPALLARLQQAQG